MAQMGEPEGFGQWGADWGDESIGLPDLTGLTVADLEAADGVDERPVMMGGQGQEGGM